MRSRAGTTPELADHDRPLAPRGRAKRRGARRAPPRDGDLAGADPLLVGAAGPRDTRRRGAGARHRDRDPDRGRPLRRRGGTADSRGCERFREATPSVMLIGHNPGLEDLAARLDAQHVRGAAPDRRPRDVRARRRLGGTRPPAPRRSSTATRRAEPGDSGTSSTRMADVGDRQPDRSRARHSANLDADRSPNGGRAGGERPSGPHRVPADESCQARARRPRPGSAPAGAGRHARSRAPADPVRPHAGLAVHLLPRRRGGDGPRPRGPAEQRSRGAERSSATAS